jgi:hypothetical protein
MARMYPVCVATRRGLFSKQQQLLARDSCFLTLELSKSRSNSSNMTPKLKPTPSAIMLTKKEAATTTQP